MEKAPTSEINIFEILIFLILGYYLRKTFKK